MTYIRYGFWAVVAVCMIAVGLANRTMTELSAMPKVLADALGLSPTIELPLFVLLFLGVGLGLLIGFLWEWIREYKERVASRAKDRELAALRREIASLKDEKHEGHDEVLALLDKAS
jgi:putative membrane protein